MSINLYHQLIFLLWAPDINDPLPPWSLILKLCMSEWSHDYTCKIWLFPVSHLSCSVIISDIILSLIYHYLIFHNWFHLFSKIINLSSMFTSLYRHCHDLSLSKYHFYHDYHPFLAYCSASIIPSPVRLIF